MLTLLLSKAVALHPQGKMQRGGTLCSEGLEGGQGTPGESQGEREGSALKDEESHAQHAQSPLSAP